jgi:hypothetical protein
MSRYGSVGDAPAPLFHGNYHARCRYRPEEPRPRYYVVVERQTSAVVASGLPSYEAAWSWIANRLGPGKRIFLRSDPAKATPDSN